MVYGTINLRRVIGEIKSTELSAENDPQPSKGGFKEIKAIKAVS
jgi:hypothetical protein